MQKLQFPSQNILELVKLIRLNRPIGIWLLLWPCLFSLALLKNLHQLKVVSIFILGSILMRSAACIINDFFDRDFDNKVKRTKDRPLASGTLPSKHAAILLVVLLSLSLALLLQLNNLTILLGIFSIIPVVIYPLMKRITYFPQLFLGLTNNFGCIMAATSTTNEISLTTLILYLACIAWTLGYDSIYAFMDLEYDLKIAIKSTAIKLQHHPRLYLALFYLIFISLLALLGICQQTSIGYYLCLLSASPLIFWQIAYLDIIDAHSCQVRFNANQYLGAIIFIALIIK